MSADWVYALDMCAANGIIDYDAASDILGETPRYVGHPDINTVPTIHSALLPSGTKLPDMPKSDEFVKPKKNDSLVENPSWKKWLFGIGTAVTIGGLIVGSLIKKGKIKIPQNIKNLGQNIWNGFKKPFVWIASKFKKAPIPPTP